MAFCPKADSSCNFSFSQTIAAFFGSPGLPFVDILNGERIGAVFAKHNNLFGRTYTTSIVLWAFMSQVLRDGKEASCQSAVARISSYRSAAGLEDIDPDTRDYCRARAKLSEAALHELSTDIANEAERLVEEQHLWKGRHAKLVDGSTFLMADTPANQAEYPQNPAQKPGIGFPIARFVAIISLATGCVMDCAITKYKGKETGETALLRQLIGSLNKGDVVVADRFYGNYWMIALLMQAGVDVCFRKHQGRHSDFRRGRRLGKYDHVVKWGRPKRPSWMSKEVYDTIPTKLELRELRYTAVAPGRKQEPFIIITTITDAEGDDGASKEELADLYSYRWNTELDIRSMKTHMNLNHLRCKSPEMVRKEFWVTILAYNSIRITGLAGSWVCGVRPREISFVSCCQFVLAAWDKIDSLSGMLRRRYCLGRLERIAQCRVGQRPGRYEPRVRKKRGSNYNLMMKPRQDLKNRLAVGDNWFESK
ncbi:MAG: IS4 family transposase [Planctomycetota bacterium]